MLGLSAPPANVSDQMIQRLSTMTPEQAVATQSGWAIPGQHVYCVGSLPDPVLACQWGPGANVITDRAIFWRDGKRWRTQPYPKEGVRGVAGFSRIQLSGDELFVIMNVGVAQTRYAEQPQLLNRTRGGWKMFWLPPEREWSGSHAIVQFAGDSADRFLVWTDRFALPKAEAWPFVGEFGRYLERWERRDDRFVRVSRTEAVQPEMAIIHLVQALARGDHRKAANWAEDETLVNTAEALGLQKAAAVGFVPPRRVKGQVYLLEANNYARKPSWLVRVAWQSERWQVAGIQPGQGPQVPEE